jgi:group I intron endonuclease
MQILKNKTVNFAIFCVKLYMEKKFIVYAVVVAFLLKAYVGSTVRPDKRWDKEHLPKLRHNRHENKAFQQAFNEFGEDACYYVCIEAVDDIALLPKREEFWIKELKKDGAAFNLNISGTPGMRGKRLSSETRKKMSKAKTGKNHPDNRKDFAFMSPDGKLFNPHGLREFCQENGLTISAMSRLANRRQKVHRGWTNAITS